MKYLIILLVLLTGCNNNEQIKYNNKLINKEDYNYVHNKLKKINYNSEEINIPFTNTLTVFKDNSLDIYNISEDGIRYKKGDKEYYSTSDTTELLEYLNKNYTVDSIYNLIKTNHFEKEKDDLYIKLDNSNNYYILYLKDKINNLNISSNHTLYYQKKATNNRIVIEYKDNVKISFNNKYNNVKINTKDIK